MRRKSFVFLIAGIFCILASSCNLPQPTATATQQDADQVHTSAAQTIAALSTEMGVESTSTPVPTGAESATNTPEIIVNTEIIPTNTSIPLFTATPTEPAVPCDRAHFVKDVTVPDGTKYAPGKEFTKTWELENSGSCTWNSNYSLVFANEGNAMDGAPSQQLTTGTVAPGEKIQVSVDLKAPTKPGSYKGYWELRNSSGVTFGTGDTNEPFYVDIVVVSESYNFVDKYCKAEWRSGAGKLDCPGDTGDEDGFVVKVDDPEFAEQTENEDALWATPEDTEDGEIRGIFPSIDISEGQYFKGVIGCQKGATNCDYKFYINYKTEDGSEETLKKWSVTYDDFIKINVDLSSLAGESVKFILIVDANGEMDDDEALLMQLRVE